MQRLPARPLCLSAKNGPKGAIFADKAQILICKKWPYLGHLAADTTVNGRVGPLRHDTSPISPHMWAYHATCGPIGPP